MRAIAAIARNELRSRFSSPSTWFVLCANAGVLGFLFLLQLEQFIQIAPQLESVAGAPGVTELVVMPLLRTAAFAALISVPVLTMNAIADERRQGTLVVLLAAPVTALDIVAGKFIGLAVVLLVLVGVIAIAPAMLLVSVDLDFGLLTCGLFGVALTMLSMAALGLTISAFAPTPMVAALLTLGTLLGLWILGLTAIGGLDDNVVGYLSMTGHLDRFLRGLLRVQDIGYFTSLTLGAVLLGTWRVDLARAKP